MYITKAGAEPLRSPAVSVVQQGFFQCTARTRSSFYSWRGPRGPKSISTFFVVFYRRELKLPGTFFGMKKYCSYPKLSQFELSKIHTITLCAWTLITIQKKQQIQKNPRRSTLKSIFCYSFWDIDLKLGNFDWLDFRFGHQKWKYWI